MSLWCIAWKETIGLSKVARSKWESASKGFVQMGFGLYLCWFFRLFLRPDILTLQTLSFSYNYMSHLKPQNDFYFSHIGLRYGSCFDNCIFFLSYHHTSQLIVIWCCRYRDPKTGLPYATKEAFKIIRERYGFPYVPLACVLDFCQKTQNKFFIWLMQYFSNTLLWCFHPTPNIRKKIFDFFMCVYFFL